MPPEQQQNYFPRQFRDVMRIRRDVLVKERGRRLEDIASDLEGDSVSFHWVLYFTSWIESENIRLEGIQDKYEKIWTQVPIATIRVRPVIGMVCYSFPQPLGRPRSQGHGAANRHGALTGTARRRENHTFLYKRECTIELSAAVDATHSRSVPRG